MSVFRADLYIAFKVKDFHLGKSSERFFQQLCGVTELTNLQMTHITRDREIQGKIKIEEWYEMTGAIDVAEGGKAFWALCKESSQKEPYNFFLRLDRNITASDYDTAQKQAVEWAGRAILQPLQSVFTIKELTVSSPSQLSKKATTLGSS